MRDPQCAPIDTIIRIIYRDGCGTVFGIPCEADEVEEEDVSRLMRRRAVVDDWARGNPRRGRRNRRRRNPDRCRRRRYGSRWGRACGVESDRERMDGRRAKSSRTGIAAQGRGRTGQYAPYQVRLDRRDMGSGLIFAPYDDDACVRAE